MTNQTAPAAAKKSGAPKAEDRVETIFTASRSDIAAPVVTRRGGSKSALRTALESLEVGFSVGVSNKTKKQLSTPVSKINTAADNQRPVKDEAGNVVMLPGDPIKDAAGNVVGHQPGKPKTERIREFEIHEVDPKKDPDKVSVRIFRVK